MEEFLGFFCLHKSKSVFQLANSVRIWHMNTVSDQGSGKSYSFLIWRNPTCRTRIDPVRWDLLESGLPTRARARSRAEKVLWEGAERQERRLALGGATPAGESREKGSGLIPMMAC